MIIPFVSISSLIIQYHKLNTRYLEFKEPS